MIDINGFICPKEGRWPHPADCEKFYNCDSGVGVEAWCGHGMTYDVDHERCDLAKNIDCKDGERPSWIPPAEWQMDSLTDSIYFSTTPPYFFNNENEIKKLRKILFKPTSSSRLINSKMLLPTIVLMENSPCTFQGNLPDQDNCQFYFTCKDELITRFQCPDRHLFDADLRSCNDYRKVYCGNRPTNEHKNDPCIGQSNGWYAEKKSQCRKYYLCTEQQQMKIDECPIGSKWNPHRLVCDDPRYILPPCGYLGNTSVSLLGYYYYITIFMAFSVILLIF